METLRIGSAGPDVMLVQSLLTKIGYDPGPIDGVFGRQTQQAVIATKGTTACSGRVVGPATRASFERYLVGYDSYTIKPGDTLYLIAARYHTSVEAILTANPGIEPQNLVIGRTIIVPYGIDVVFTDIDYTYEVLERDVQGLKARYPFLETGPSGKVFSVKTYIT